MGERKVLNRYIPADFDPSIIPKAKRDRNKLAEVRMMLPFSLRCNTCGEYMYRGKKFNSKKEMLLDEDYMGIRKFRFYIKCSVCSAEITFKTDPKNADYECEIGASRNYELWRESQEVTEEDNKLREEEEQDAMKALENKTIGNKMEMDVLDALDEMKAINQRHRHVDTNLVLQKIANKASSSSQENHLLQQEQANSLTVEDEELIKSIKFGAKRSLEQVESSAVPTELSANATTSSSSSSTSDNLITQLQKQVTKTSTNIVPVIIKKKRKVDEVSNNKAVSEDSAPLKKEEAPPVPPQVPVQVPEASTGITGLFMDYGDDSDE